MFAAQIGKDNVLTKIWEALVTFWIFIKYNGVIRVSTNANNRRSHHNSSGLGVAIIRDCPARKPAVISAGISLNTLSK